MMPDYEILHGRITGLEHETAELVRLGASDQRVDGLEQRLDEALARIVELERHIAHLEHPSRPQTKARR
jgi:hypothetical protein